jgi:hypothetical protein
VSGQRDASVRPLLVGCPLDDLFDVGGIVRAEVIKAPLRAAGAAQVEHDDRVAARDEVARKPEHAPLGIAVRQDARAVAVVQRAVIRARFHDGRPGTVAVHVGIGPDDLDVELDAVVCADAVRARRDRREDRS